jgi:hypothetical protein
MPLEVMRRLAGDRASDTLRRSILHGGIGCLLDDGLRDLRVRVAALLQRAACECIDACRCCQLSSKSLALPLYSLAVEIRQNIRRLQSSLCILYSSTASSTACTNIFSSFPAIYEYIYYLCVCVSLSIHIYILRERDSARER